MYTLLYISTISSIYSAVEYDVEIILIPLALLFTL